MDSRAHAGSVKRHIRRISDDDAQRVEDFVAVEKRLTIRVNGKEALSVYCSPIQIKELVVGLLSTEGIIKGGWCADDIAVTEGAEIIADVEAEAGARVADLSGAVMTSGCVGGVTFPAGQNLSKIESSLKITTKTLMELYRNFQAMSGLHRLTGCVHSAALSDGIEILAFAEDLGRHNAIDKIVGISLTQGRDFRDTLMLTSGRISSEAVRKCARWAIALIASRTAPTDLALDVADKYGITVCGFLRGARMNVYTHPERVL